MIWILFYIFCTTCLAGEGISEANLYRSHSAPQHQLALNALNELTLEPGDRVLDVGCGDGKITALIASKLPDGEVVGLDISTFMIACAEAQFASPNLRFIQGSATEVPFTESFDKVVSFSALHWVVDQKRALQSMKESLRPQGTMLLVLPQRSSGSVGSIAQGMKARWSQYLSIPEQQRVYYTPEEYEQLLKEVGLDIVNIQSFEEVALHKDRQWLRAWLIPLLNFVDELPCDLREQFIEEFMDAMTLAAGSTNPDGSIAICLPTLQVLARKL